MGTSIQCFSFATPSSILVLGVVGLRMVTLLWYQFKWIVCILALQFKEKSFKLCTTSYLPVRQHVTWQSCIAPMYLMVLLLLLLFLLLITGLLICGLFFVRPWFESTVRCVLILCVCTHRSDLVKIRLNILPAERFHSLESLRAECCQGFLLSFLKFHFFVSSKR